MNCRPVTVAVVVELLLEEVWFELVLLLGEGDEEVSCLLLFLFFEPMVQGFENYVYSELVKCIRF